MATAWHRRGGSLSGPRISVRREATRAGEAEIERDAFTTDELDVIELIANGHTDRAIARRLSVSVVTVRRRATSFRTKIGARNRAEAIAIAAGRGWLVHPAVRARGDDK
ncbi:MAG TPA: helix-turn-helix transcriptional regulator [Actinomycetota bacterium]|nr:helix-turn-helix transcriptional regulator [Actinomycetota bacterium]